VIELPAGWQSAPIGDLIARDGLFVDGDWVESKDQDPVGEVRLTQLADVGDGRWRNRSDRHLTAAAAARLRCTDLQVDDVLVARMPDPLGRACLFPGDPKRCVTVVDVAIIRPGTGSADPRWLMHAINAPLVRTAIESLQSGTTRRRISRKNLGTVEVAVAPLQEQLRIAAAIEEAFSKLAAGEAGLSNVRQLLKRTRDAVLTVAATGHLVPQDPTDTPAAKILTDLGIEPVEPSEGSHVPDGWASVRIVDIAQVGSGTTPKRGRSEYWENGQVPWVTSGALNAGVVSEATEFVTERALAETSLRLWPAGTLLVAMYGEGQTRGRCAELAIEATCNQACAAIALRPELADYKQTLRLHFDANYSANRRLAAGGVQPNLSGALIKEMVVGLPPPEEASRIVAGVERQMSFIEACERSVDAGLEVSAALRRSVLRAAFEGRLVPQDPTDEPASVLLERIRADRAAVPKPKKRRAGVTA
jgi:type I restriction enzyme S subunit